MSIWIVAAVLLTHALSAPIKLSPKVTLSAIAASFASPSHGFTPLPVQPSLREPQLARKHLPTSLAPLHVSQDKDTNDIDGMDNENGRSFRVPKDPLASDDGKQLDIPDLLTFVSDREYADAVMEATHRLQNASESYALLHPFEDEWAVIEAAEREEERRLEREIQGKVDSSLVKLLQRAAGKAESPEIALQGRKARILEFLAYNCYGIAHMLLRGVHDITALLIVKKLIELVMGDDAGA
ncbi:MAG: hypothetical protein SGCHY_003799 [Lobulomycetales sp.]